ncbi:hypothetical protein HUN08_13125 [Gordonia sp. X0973]|uniref:hypothetical protein n=1 Tax=Gordonia sp. X0973 TaxID=2742602 RepID=UPI000F536BD0|nr:hypothetical protein [Gordonia sp. X0973]QKT08019.1 hypothetical protein HUN08_13125 [Gordonia sp. X0973]
MIFSILIAGLLAATAVALFIGLRNRGPSAQKLAEMSSGTLTVTGVNERPAQGDANGQAYLTVSGTIMGPDIAPTEVYGSFTHSLAGAWPQIGQDLPVRYNPRKVEQSWVLMSD